MTTTWTPTKIHMNDNSHQQGGLGPRGREILFQPTAGDTTGGATLVQVADDGVPVTTSLIIAAETGNQHKNVLGLIRDNLADLNDVGMVAFETRVAGQSPNPTVVASLDEAAAALLLTYLRNTPKIKAFKKALVAEFYAMRDMLVGHTTSMTLAEQCLFNAQALVEQERRLWALESTARRVEAILPAQREEIFYSARAWAKLNDLVATRTYLQHLGAIAGRIGRSEGLSPDRIPDGRDGAVNGWPLWVWDRAYAEVSA